MSKKKSRRGGYRPGAGRKPKYGERMAGPTIPLPPAVLQILDDLAGDTKSRSDVILALLGKAHKPIRDAIDKLKRAD
jgi:hypothetical protein